MSLKLILPFCLSGFRQSFRAFSFRTKYQPMRRPAAPSCLVRRAIISFSFRYSCSCTLIASLSTPAGLERDLYAAEKNMGHARTVMTFNTFGTLRPGNIFEDLNLPFKSPFLFSTQRRSLESIRLYLVGPRFLLPSGSVYGRIMTAVKECPLSPNRYSSKNPLKTWPCIAISRLALQSSTSLRQPG